MAASPISTNKFNILVVDVDDTSLGIVSSMLKQWKYQVTSMNSPIDALAIIESQDFDLVVSDLHMPEMNGLELQKQIDEKYKLPVIIMSSDDNETVIMDVLASGAVFYLQKPVNPQDLRNIWQYAVTSKTAKSEARNTERIGSIQGGSSDQINLEPSVNKERKHGKRKTHKANKENEKGEGEGQGKRKKEISPKRPKIIWTYPLHYRFLQAINYITLEKAVPKKVLEFMEVPGLTRENVASHLQKYRDFLRRVAENGFAATARNSMTMDNTFRSCFVVGHAAMLFKSAKEPYSLFQELEQQTSTRNASFSNPYPNLNLNYSNSNSNNNSVGIQIHNAGEQLPVGGQMRINGEDGLVVNGADVDHQNPIGDSFNHGNFQTPPSFSGVNEQGAGSSSMAPQQPGLENDIVFNLMIDSNHDSAGDNTADLHTKMSELSAILAGPTDSQLPDHQVQETQELVNTDLANNNAIPSNDYYPILDNIPNQQQDGNGYSISELNNLFPAQNAGLGNLQGWDDDDFIDSLLNDGSF